MYYAKNNMKLLLTSAGLTNQKITDKLFELVGKKPPDTTVAYIPTAMNPESGDKTWLLDKLNELKHTGIKELDIVDIAALTRDEWEPRLMNADVLSFSGGDTEYLAHHVETSGLSVLLPELLKKRVYVGESAGSILTGLSLITSSPETKKFITSNYEYRSREGLKFVPFYVRSHYQSPAFPFAAKEILEDIAKHLDDPICALDDQSALAIVDGEVEEVGEGTIQIFTNKIDS